MTEPTFTLEQAMHQMLSMPMPDGEPGEPRYTLDEARGLLDEQHQRRHYEFFARLRRGAVLGARQQWAPKSHLPYARFGEGVLHAANCHVVANGIARADEYLHSPPDGMENAGTPTYPMMLTEDEARLVGGRRCAVCAPGIPIPPKRAPRFKTSGLGWPIDDQKCARSRLSASGRANHGRRP